MVYPPSLSTAMSGIDPIFDGEWMLVLVNDIVWHLHPKYSIVFDSCQTRWFFVFCDLFTFVVSLRPTTHNHAESLDNKWPWAAETE